MHDDFSRLLDEMTASVAKDEKGDLALGWRLRLWSVMKRHFGPEASLRRSALAFVVAKSLLPYWSGDQLSCEPLLHELFDDYPANALRICKRYLEGGVSVEELHDAGIRMDRDYDCLTSILPEGRMGYAYVAARAFFFRVDDGDDEMYEDHGLYEAAWIGSRRLQIRESSVGEWDSYETHYWAAEFASYTDSDHVYHPSPKNYARRRAFWLSWLKDTVPLVLETKEQVVRLLEV